MPQLTTERDAFLIGGRPAAAGCDWVDVISPATEEPTGRIRRAELADVDAAVDAARRAFEAGPWARMALEERGTVILDALSRLRPQTEEIARLITTEMGAPVADTVGQHVPGALGMGRSFVRHAGTLELGEVRQGRYAWALVEREPVGVVGAIAAWNGPFNFAVQKIVPALLAGCPVVFKPALETPFDAFALAEALYEAGLPDGMVSIIPGSGEIGEHLVRHPGVDKVSFTGSTTAGRRVGGLCGELLKRADLELGGKSAALVLDDADLDETIPALVAGGFFNAGQVCAALTRVLVPAGLHDELVERLAAAAQDLTVGDPLDPTTQLGPLVSAAQRDRVEATLRGAEADGAKILTGGRRPAGVDRGFYFEPTILTGAPPTATVVREEIFGPVMAVLPFESEEEAIAMANDSPYGLHGGVYTADPEHGVEVARRIVTGAVSVNSFTLNTDAPFGGRKASGIGREFGPEGIAGFFEYKTINVPEPVAQARLRP